MDQKTAASVFVRRRMPAAFLAARAAAMGVLGVALLIRSTLGQAEAPALAPTAPLAEHERQLASTLVRGDARLHTLIGEGSPRVIMSDVIVDKGEAEEFLTGASSTPPGRRVWVLLFNPRANRAARALVALDQNRILRVERVDAAHVPIGAEDVEAALALAKGQAALRQSLGENAEKFRILQPGQDAQVPFAVQALPVSSSDPRDACHTHRCLDLIFRTEQGYLPLRVHVDLTKRTAAVEGRAQ